MKLTLAFLLAVVAFPAAELRDNPVASINLMTQEGDHRSPLTPKPAHVPDSLQLEASE